MEVDRWEKIVGWVTRGVERKYDVGVGVTLEVRLHRFKKY